jgi:hypothetical protein
MIEGKWAIYIKKIVKGDVPTWDWVRFDNEKMFSSEEECKKRVDALNSGNPDEPYSCQPLEGSFAPRRRP